MSNLYIQEIHRREYLENLSTETLATLAVAHEVSKLSAPVGRSSGPHVHMTASDGSRTLKAAWEIFTEKETER